MEVQICVYVYNIWETDAYYIMSSTPARAKMIAFFSQKNKAQALERRLSR